MEKQEGLSFFCSAFITAIFYILPDFHPFFPPAKRSVTYRTNLLRKVFFFNLFHWVLAKDGKFAKALKHFEIFGSRKGYKIRKGAQLYFLNVSFCIHLSSFRNFIHADRLL